MLQASDISKLWVRMARIYGHRWVSSYTEADDGTWLSGLHDLIPCELAAGLRRCIHRGDSWPPSLPEFRQICFDLAPQNEAVEQAISGRSSNPVSAKLVKLVSSWDLTHNTIDQLRRSFQGLYDQALSMCIAERLRLPDEERQRLTGIEAPENLKSLSAA